MLRLADGQVESLWDEVLPRGTHHEPPYAFVARIEAKPEKARTSRRS
jgi:hypothetical protein